MPQKDLRLVHASFEPRVHVPNQRRGHGAIDARIDGRRPGGQHQPNGRVEFANVLRHDVCPSLFWRSILAAESRNSPQGALGEVSCHGGNFNFRAIPIGTQPTIWLALLAWGLLSERADSKIPRPQTS